MLPNPRRPCLLAFFGLAVGILFASVSMGAGETAAQTVKVPHHTGPEAALDAALASPLIFAGRFSGREIDSKGQVCLFRNADVLLRLDFCGFKDHEGKIDFLDFVIFLADGTSYVFDAQVAAPLLEAAQKRREFTIRMQYRVHRRAKPPAYPSLSTEAFVAFSLAAKTRQFGECHMHEGKPRCTRIADNEARRLKRAFATFMASPPPQWFQLAAELHTKSEAHGEKPSDRKKR